MWTDFYYHRIAVDIMNSLDMLYIFSSPNQMKDNIAFKNVFQKLKAVKNAVIVGSIDQNGKTDHTIGLDCDILAPGYQQSTYIDNGYTYFEGTSAAAPVISAIAALMLSCDPLLSPLEIKRALIEAAGENQFMQGLVNAGASLKKIKEAEGNP